MAFRIVKAGNPVLSGSNLSGDHQGRVGGRDLLRCGDDVTGQFGVTIEAFHETLLCLFFIHDGDTIFGMAERNFGGHDPENNVGLTSFLGKAGADGIQLVFQGDKEGTPGNIFRFGDLFFQAADEEIFFFRIQCGVQAVSVQIQDQMTVGAAVNQGLHHGVEGKQCLILMPGSNGAFYGLLYAFRAGGQDDGRNSDHFRVLVGDHVTDYGFVILFLHIIEQTVGVLPVFRGKGENIQFDLQKIAEIFSNDGQGLETEQSEFCAGILGHFDAAQYVIIADTDINNGNMDRLGNHVCGICAGDDNVILFAVAPGNGKSLFHAAGEGGQLNFRVLQGALLHECHESFIGSNSKNADFFHV